MIIAIIAAAAAFGATTASADSFGFYFGDDGFGINLNFGDYDYYDRYSPGFYESGGLDFRAALTPYGSWRYDIELGGHIWVPRVTSGWRPYMNGSWSYTQYGWTWVAYEPWGWIPHHYGNWIHHHFHGWVWVPGYEWAPARVTWGYFGGYYGWAPLPPRHCNYYRNHYGSRYRNTHHHHHHHHHWYSHTNYSRNPFILQEHDNYAYNDAYYRSIPNNAWVMVNNRDFAGSNMADVAVSLDRIPSVLSRSRFEILDKAPDKYRVERYTGRTISRVKVDEVVKNVDGHKVKLVRPVDVLENNKNHVTKVQRQFKPQQVNKPGNVNKPQAKPRVKKPTSNYTVNKTRPQTINRKPSNPQVNRNVYKPQNNSKPKVYRNQPKPQQRNPQIRKPAPRPNVNKQNQINRQRQNQVNRQKQNQVNRQKQNQVNKARPKPTQKQNKVNNNNKKKQVNKNNKNNPVNNNNKGLSLN